MSGGAIFGEDARSDSPPSLGPRWPAGCHKRRRRPLAKERPGAAGLRCRHVCMSTVQIRHERSQLRRWSGADGGPEPLPGITCLETEAVILPTTRRPPCACLTPVFGAQFELSSRTGQPTAFQHCKVRACSCPNAAHNYRALGHWGGTPKAPPFPHFPHCHCNLLSWGLGGPRKGLCSSAGKHLTHQAHLPPSPPAHLPWPGLGFRRFRSSACPDTGRDPPPLASFGKTYHVNACACCGGAMMPHVPGTPRPHHSLTSCCGSCPAKPSKRSNVQPLATPGVGLWTQ